MSLAIRSIAAGAALIAGAALMAGASHSRKLRTAMPPVRNAGADEMDNPPPDWDKDDDVVDQSFPASDPPGNY